MTNRISFQLIVILAGSLILGAAFNHFSSGGISLSGSHSAVYVSTGRAALYPEEILSGPGRALTLEEAFTLHKTGSAVFIDARPPSFYQAEHIRDAISIYYKTAGLNPALDRLKKNDPYVVYCKGPNCNQAQLLSDTMQRAGFTKIYLFPGGMQEWRLAQYPMNRTP